MIKSEKFEFYGEVYEVGLFSDGKTYISEDSMVKLEKMMMNKTIPEDKIREFCDILANYKFPNN